MFLYAISVILEALKHPGTPQFLHYKSLISLYLHTVVQCIRLCNIILPSRDHPALYLADIKVQSVPVKSVPKSYVGLIHTLG